MKHQFKLMDIKVIMSGQSIKIICCYQGQFLEKLKILNNRNKKDSKSKNLKRNTFNKPLIKQIRAQQTLRN